MKLSAAILCLWFTCLAGRGAPFGNLDFESGNTNSSQIEFATVGISFKRLTFGTGPVADLIPGWSVSLGGIMTNMMAVGSGYFGETNGFPMPTHAALLNRGDNVYHNASFDGAYALVMDNSRRESLSDNAVVFVSQEGDVPRDAKKLIFRSPPFSAVAVGLDQEWFGYLDLDRDASDLSRYSLDIVPWAGKTITLRFGVWMDGYAVIDSIGFLVDVPLTITRNGGGSDEPGRVTITFPTTPDRNHFVEFRDALNTSTPWQPLPNGPHNSGAAVDTAGESQRFYRVRMTYLP